MGKRRKQVCVLEKFSPYTKKLVYVQYAVYFIRLTVVFFYTATKIWRPTTKSKLISSGTETQFDKTVIYYSLQYGKIMLQWHKDNLIV